MTHRFNPWPDREPVKPRSKYARGPDTRQRFKRRLPKVSGTRKERKERRIYGEMD